MVQMVPMIVNLEMRGPTWSNGKDTKSNSEMGNGSRQAVSIVLRKTKTDEIPEEEDNGPDGWIGTRDMPEEVRRGRTTGGTSHHTKS